MTYTRGLPFSPQQITVLALLGAVLWFIAAMMIRVLAPMGVFEGMARIWLYGLIIPGTIPFLLITTKLAKVGREHIFLAVAVMTTSATLIDGIVLAWFPTVYGTEIDYIAGAGGTILWGVGVGLVLAFFLNKPAQS